METGESRQIVVGSLPTRALLCFFVSVFFFFLSLIQRRGGVVDGDTNCRTGLTHPRQTMWLFSLICSD